MGDSALFIAVDLTAAFDTADHTVQLSLLDLDQHVQVLFVQS